MRNTLRTVTGTSASGTGFDGTWYGTNLYLEAEQSASIQTTDNNANIYIKSTAQNTTDALLIQSDGDMHIHQTCEYSASGDFTIEKSGIGDLFIQTNDDANISIQSLSGSNIIAINAHGGTLYIGGTTDTLSFFGSSGSTKASTPTTLEDVISILQGYGLCN